jgi:hypothetical protein
MIAVKFLTSWFIPDLIAVIPFDVFIESSSVNKLARVSRIGKVYKLVRIAKLSRLIRFLKVQNKMMK